MKRKAAGKRKDLKSESRLLIKREEGYTGIHTTGAGKMSVALICDFRGVG